MPACPIYLDAADISRKALSAAKRAIYGKGSFRQPLTAEQEKFFRRTPQGLQVADAVVRTVHFYRDNLVDPGFLAGHAPYHILFCKNVLIYLTDEARKKVLKNFDRLLAPQGILFTGHAEMGFLQQNGFTAVRHPRAFACRRTEHAPAPIAAPETRLLPYSVTPSPPPKMMSVTAAVKAPSPAAPPSSPKKGVEALLDEAKALANQGLFQEADTVCREYLRDHLPHAGIYCLLGLIHEAIGRTSEAEECYLKALYLDPDHYESLIQTSLLYQQKGNTQQAALFRRRAEQREGGPDGRNRT
jgi:chemotaxis protein methyltransferase WspC